MTSTTTATIGPATDEPDRIEPDRNERDRGRPDTHGRTVHEPVVDVVVPVYDEAADLERSVRRLHGYLTARLPYTFRITIADNASTDATPEIADRLAGELDEVEWVRLEQKGRGRALEHVWSRSDALVLAYMDVDLSTDLDGLLPLVAPLLSGHSHVAIGSRLAAGSHVVRGPKRELISRCYNVILHRALSAKFSDAQCGFKAIRRDVARELLPHVEDTGWFFDTELLVLAERSGLRVHEVPVDWVDDPDSRVDIVATATADLRGVARLVRSFARGSVPTSEIRDHLGGHVDPAPAFRQQVAWFATIGVASTIAYTALFLLLRTWTSAQVANLLALATTAVLNTALNRRFTFGVRGSSSLLRHHGQGLVVFLMALGITGGSLAALHAWAPAAPRAVELGVVVVANLAASVVRFLGLRVWVFARHRSAPDTAMADAPIADAPIAGTATSKV